MTVPSPSPSNAAATAPDPDFRPGLEGVIAFESEIAEPDKEGGFSWEKTDLIERLRALA